MTASQNPGSGEGTRPVPKVRLAWPDVAKGISIVGVVLLHITLTVPESQGTWLASLNVWLDPLRLPLFFLISGYFSQKVFRFSFGELFRRRLWFFIVPYCVWMAIELWLKRIEYHWVFGDPLLSWQELFSSMLLGNTIAWFIHALIVFNLFLWCVRKLPAWAAIGLSLVPLLFMPLNQSFSFISKAVMFLPIFVGAAFMRRPITRFAELIEAPFKGQATVASWWAYVATAAAYAVGYSIRRAWDLYQGDVAVPWLLPGADVLVRADIHILIRALEQACEVPLGIVVSVAISFIPGLSGFLRFVGRHTLPIYLGHPIGLTLGYGFFMAHYPRPVALEGDWPLGNTWFWLLCCAGFAAAASLALWLIGRIPILGWTMNPPPLPPRGRRASEPFSDALTTGRASGQDTVRES